MSKGLFDIIFKLRPLAKEGKITRDQALEMLQGSGATSAQMETAVQNLFKDTPTQASGIISLKPEVELTTTQKKIPEPIDLSVEERTGGLLKEGRDYKIGKEGEYISLKEGKSWKDYVDTSNPSYKGPVDNFDTILDNLGTLEELNDESLQALARESKVLGNSIKQLENMRDNSEEYVLMTNRKKKVDNILDVANMIPRSKNTSFEDRAKFLDTIAEEIEAVKETLLKITPEETGLPEARITGETGRTVGQLRMFAEFIRNSKHTDATIDEALPDRQPLPRPDLRLRNVAIGPVAVFGASNFPLAFSVAGGDTASALAAGCPVIVKAHSSHPRTSEIIGRCIQNAVKKNNLPDGTFSLLFGSGNIVGQGLVKNKYIKAVGFTGSRSGGLQIVKTAQSRNEPIPVYAEMSSINLVFVFNSVLENPDKFIEGFLVSLQMGAGQFCTNPGLIITQNSKNYENFKSKLAEKIKEQNIAEYIHR